jgi:phosphopantetheinyl transferase
VAELTVLGLTEVQLSRGRSLALLVEPAPARLEMRNILRMVLGQITARSPEALRFETTSAGKPYLAGDHPVAFSLSHSRSRSLIAVALSGDIGCDVEDRFRTDDDVGQLSPSILHPVEQQEMDALAAPKRQDAFKRYWVRKEAALKAAGSGFLKDPRGLIVGLDFAQARWSENGGPDLYLHNRQLGQDCFAAVASMDPDCAWCLLQP